MKTRKLDYMETRESGVVNRLSETRLAFYYLFALVLMSHKLSKAIRG